MIGAKACAWVAALSATGLALVPTGASGELRSRDEAELALGEGNCFACHAAADELVARVQPAPGPDLSQVGARVAPTYLGAFLEDPHATKPGTRMPDLLAGFPDEERCSIALRLAHFLSSLGGPFDATPTSGYAAEIEEGRQLFHEVGCVQCHAPQQEAWELEYTFRELEEFDASELVRTTREPTPGVAPPRDVPLGELASKTSVDELARFLADPLAVRPAGRMPSLGLTDDEAHDIAVYLLRDQASGVEHFPGLAYEYFEAPFVNEVPVPDFDVLDVERVGTVTDMLHLPEHRDEEFGFRYRGFVRVETPGEYTFFTSSDDGSRLSIDRAVVVRNDGPHGMTEESGQVALTAGRHAITVTYFEITGDDALEVRWEGPGVEKAPISSSHLSHLAASLRPPGGGFRVHPALAEEGRAYFAELGCVACHTTGDATLDALPRPEAPAFDALRDDAGGGCLADEPRARVPHFELGERRAALVALLRDPAPLTTPQHPEQRVAATMQRFGCTACHSRGGEGGPHPDRRAYFYIKGGFDIGDEGRIPPALDEPGAKLRPAWLERVLFDGGVARPYMATRMPQFGADNLRGLPALFVAADGKPGDAAEPPFSLEAVENGRRVVGVRGLGCINCHTLAGHESLGIPAVDLARLYDRLQPDWFRRLLTDPIALNMNTRMPEFWVGGKSPVEGIYDGDPDRQIDAMWSYFSLGNAMPLPDGLVVPDEVYELRPTDAPVLCGVFMKDVSPRTLVVGFPEQTHYAFDVQNSRLAKLWRGRFFNTRGTWQGRAGALEIPAGENVLDLPAGPAFARLADAESAWPDAADGEALRALGRSFDEARRPVFAYALGDVTIEERPFPEVVPGGTKMHRAFRLTAPHAIDDLWFRGPAGRRRVEFKPRGDGRFEATFEEVVEW